MKLTQVELTSFRSYAGVTLDLNAPRVLLAGLNGTGKTSIRDALAFCLLGHCRGTDARGAGADILIPDGGSSNVEVAVTIEGIGRVSRLYSEKGGSAFSVEGFTGTSQAQQQGLLMKLDTTPEYLDAVLDRETFLALGHADAKALVLSLLNVRIKVGDKSYTLDELDVHYKTAFEDRKLAKRALAQIVPPEKPSGSMPTVEQIETQLSKLRADLGLLQKAVGTTAGTRTTLTHQRDRILKDPVHVGEDLSAEIAALEAQIVALEQQQVPPTVAPAKGDPNRLAFLKSQADALARFTPAGSCVLHPELGCATPAKQFEMAAASVAREIASLAPTPAVAVPVNPLTALRATYADLTWKQQLRTSHLAERDRQAERLAAIDAELAALPSTDEQDAQIAKLTERIQKGESLLRDARSFWQAMSGYDAAVQRRTEAEAEVARLETLVDELGPKGARVAALTEAMGRFEAAVNPYVQPFGWELTFSVDPWDVLANGRPVETYSRSERFRIGIALQMGIAQLSGLNFVAVDEIDVLDVGNRSAVSSMLLRAPLEQILILGTRENTQALPTTVKSYRLGIENGRSHVIEETAAA